MSNRESTLKEKFRIALTSTAKVISDDFDLNKKVSEKDKSKDTSDGSGAAEHQQRNLWLPKGMGMPQRGNNRRCAINGGVIRRSAGICDPISSRICTASNRSKSGLGLNCRAHQSAVA